MDIASYYTGVMNMGEEAKQVVRPTSALLCFFSGDVMAHPKGYTAADIIDNWDIDALEYRHDFIQWLFPITETSKFNPSAPVLTAEEAYIIREYHLGTLMNAADKMLDFYRETSDWSYKEDHNHLRITRIIKCLWLILGPVKARTWLTRLQDVIDENDYTLPPIVLAHWSEATQGRAVTVTQMRSFFQQSTE